MKTREVYLSVSPILRPAQAARLLGISRTTLYRWEAAGRLAPRVILGPGTSGWREEDLAAFIAAAPRGGPEHVPEAEKGRVG
ncbi:MAG TPA: helix-turn-helix domain-containing protein [Thermoanaerobaculia bacterium]|nr:helix-turn-helix domain-containing protein [Thermoanaerobaculia bacterium]